jgi:hypothetical protein
MTCKNCAHTFEGAYCFHCGQIATTSRITIKDLLTDFFFSAVNLNRGFLFTARALSRRPGAAIRQYLAGQRVIYYAPHKYLFLIGAVATFLTARYHSFSDEYSTNSFVDGGAHSFLEAFFQYADTYATLINIVTIPVFSLFTFLFFRNSGYNFAEHLVLNTYITAQQLLVFIVWLPLTRAIPVPVNGLLSLYVLLTLLYNAWVYVQFFRHCIRRVVLWAVLAMLLSYLGQFLLNLLFFYLRKTYF